MPAPPYVTGSRTAEEDLHRMRDALFETLEAPAMRSVKDDLLLEGAEIVPLERYQPIAEWEREALKLGYLEIQPLCAGETVR